MSRFMGFGLTVVLSASVANATDLNVSVEACDGNSITVAPGCEVDYSVLGVLSDDLNEGLALVGIDLELVDSVGDNAGALSAANNPTAGPMANFMIPDGITNPDSPCPPNCGYRGTEIGGALIQCGGGQNTIKNFEDAEGLNADFPLGMVITGLAKPLACGSDTDCLTETSVCRLGGCEQVILTGKLIAPTLAGTYTLQASNIFANVIAQGETGNPFFKTLAAGVGSVTSLEIIVDDSGTAVCFCALMMGIPNPANDSILSRVRQNIVRLEFPSSITTPPAGAITIHKLITAGTDPIDLAGSFDFSIDAIDPSILNIQDNGGTLLNETWYRFQHVAPAWPGVADFTIDLAVVFGDVSEGGDTDVTDVTQVLANRADPSPIDSRFDVNGSGAVDVTDVTLTLANRGSTKPAKP